MLTEDPGKFDLFDAVEELAAPACVVDREGRFRWLNAACVELLGDLQGRQFVDHVAPEHRLHAGAHFAGMLVGEANGIFDLAMYDGSGGRVTLRITSAPIRNGRGVVGVFAVAVPLVRVSAPESAMLDDLTPRQQQVLRLLAEGLETLEIARTLGVAEETARNHIRALLRATGAHSRLEAVLLGQRLGVVGPHLVQAPAEDGSAPAGD